MEVLLKMPCVVKEEKSAESINHEHICSQEARKVQIHIYTIIKSPCVSMTFLKKKINKELIMF